MCLRFILYSLRRFDCSSSFVLWQGSPREQVEDTGGGYLPGSRSAYDIVRCTDVVHACVHTWDARHACVRPKTGDIILAVVAKRRANEKRAQKS